MPTAYAKYLVVLLIIIGEGLAIFVETFAAKSYAEASRPFLSLFLKVFLLICLAGGFLVTGYMLGFRAFQNI